MELLADANWLIRLEREIHRGVAGPAGKLYRSAQVRINTITHAEFLSGGPSAIKLKILKGCVRLPPITYQEANRAAALRAGQAKIGKTLSTPDAFMAASAMRHGCRLLTADKDFSGIPGLDWSAYRI